MNHTGLLLHDYEFWPLDDTQGRAVEYLNFHLLTLYSQNSACLNILCTRGKYEIQKLAYELKFNFLKNIWK